MFRYLLILLVLVSVGFVFPARLEAVSIQRIDHRSPEDFGAGRLQQIVVTEQGLLSLSPQYEQWGELKDPIIWSVVSGPTGELYLGTGNEGRVYRVRKGGGKPELVADFEGLQALALAVDKAGVLYVATSPDARIYRVDGAGEPRLIVELESQYVWSLLVEESGDLLVATGVPGGVLRVSPTGETSPVLETDETHILCLARAPSGAIFAGSAESGYVYRIGKSKKGSSVQVLLDAPGEEVKQLVVAPDGSVLALTLGVADPSNLETNTLSGVLGQATAADGEGGAADYETRLYRVVEGSAPELLWHAPDVTAHSLGFFRGQALIGVGDEGKVVGVGLDRSVSFLEDFSGKQVTAMASGPDSALFLAVSNPAMFYRMETTLVKKGVFTSKVIDSGLFAHWGRIDVHHELPIRGEVLLQTRSGNTDKPNSTWSKWEDSQKGIVSPPARYLQYQLTLKLRRGEAPEIREVTVYFRPVNARPKIEEIQIMDPDVRIEEKEDFAGEPSPRGINQPLEERKETQVKRKAAPGVQSASWKAVDPNDDDLRYTVSLREAGGEHWRVLATEQPESFVNFDATAQADGWYQLKVVARDAPSNLLDEVLEDMVLSVPFPIDHVPPAIIEPQVRVEGKAVAVRFGARDETTYLSRARVSIDGGVFVRLFPDDQVYDDFSETFHYDSSAMSSGRHMIVVAVEDGVGNVVTAKLPVTIPAG